MSIEEAKKILEKEYYIIPKLDISKSVPDTVLLDCIIGVVSHKYGVPIEVLKTKSRKDRLPEIRYKAFYIALKLRPRMCRTSLGRYFGKEGKTPHSIVSQGNAYIVERLHLNPTLKTELELLEGECSKVIQTIKGIESIKKSEF